MTWDAWVWAVAAGLVVGIAFGLMITEGVC